MIRVLCLVVFPVSACSRTVVGWLIYMYCRHHPEGGRTFRAVKLSSSRDRCSKSAPAGIKHTTFSLLTLEQNSKEVCYFQCDVCYLLLLRLVLICCSNSPKFRTSDEYKLDFRRSTKQNPILESKLCKCLSGREEIDCA